MSRRPSHGGLVDGRTSGVRNAVMQCRSRATCRVKIARGRPRAVVRLAGCSGQAGRGRLMLRAPVERADRRRHPHAKSHRPRSSAPQSASARTADRVPSHLRSRSHAFPPALSAMLSEDARATPMLARAADGSPHAPPPAAGVRGCRQLPPRCRSTRGQGTIRALKCQDQASVPADSRPCASMSLRACRLLRCVRACRHATLRRVSTTDVKP